MYINSTTLCQRVLWILQQWAVGWLGYPIAMIAVDSHTIAPIVAALGANPRLFLEPKIRTSEPFWDWKCDLHVVILGYIIG